jgi:hypothetical protein
MRNVTVSLIPKAGMIRKEEIFTPREYTISSFVYTPENGGEGTPTHFKDPSTGGTGSLVIVDSIVFDLDKKIDKHNYDTLKLFMKTETDLFDFIIDDQEEKDRMEVEKAERKHRVNVRIIENKEDLPTLKAIYRRVTGFILSGVGDQSIYSKLIQLADIDTGKFFENDVFIADTKNFLEYKFIDDLVVAGLLTFENGIVRDQNKAIIGDSIEAVRYKFETNTQLKSEYAQLLQFKSEAKERTHDVVIPEAKAGSVNITTDFSEVGESDISDREDSLLFGARAILTKIDTMDSKALIRECIDAELILKQEDDDMDGGYSYKLSVAGIAFSYDQLVTHISNTPQIYNDLTEVLAKEKAMA